MIRTVLASLALAASLSASAASPAGSAAAIAPLQWGLKIPLRDGIRLNATLYPAPADTAQAACVFTLTPYVSQSYHDRGRYFSDHGYTFLTVDVRGRGNSEGRFTPLVQEVDDVRDVVEWLAKQPYCDGKVSMWGGSYAGYDQWLAAKWRSPHLRGIVPVASPWPGVDFPADSNIFLNYDVMWLTLTSGHTAQDNFFSDLPYWDDRMAKWNALQRPFAGLDADFGNPSAVFQEWLKHPAQDAYWDRFVPSEQDFAAIDLPILTIAGQYDWGTIGALDYYKAHMRLAPAAARAKHYLIIGPWEHAGTRTPRAQLGGLTFGPKSLLDLNALHKDWYDWTLKGGSRPEFLKAHVAYYMLGKGAEEWRYAETLDALTAEQRAYYLGSEQGRANDVFASGRLDTASPAAATAPPDSYVYDPLRVEVEDRFYDYDFLTTQTRAMQSHDRQLLIYHSAPFAEDTEIAGFFRFKAWLSLDQLDTDLMAWIYEIRPDGSSIFLGLDPLRARYRESPRKAQLVKPGAVDAYEFDQFPFVARRLEKGSRLRLILSAPPRKLYEHNYNSGGTVANESGKDARSVTVQLYHDTAHPSALYVPIASAGAK